MRRINAIHQLQNLPNCAGERSGAIRLLQIVGSGHLADGVVGILRKAAGEEDRLAGYLPPPLRPRPCGASLRPMPPGEAPAGRPPPPKPDSRAEAALLPDDSVTRGQTQTRTFPALLCAEEFERFQPIAVRQVPGGEHDVEFPVTQSVLELQLAPDHARGDLQASVLQHSDRVSDTWKGQSFHTENQNTDGDVLLDDCCSSKWRMRRFLPAE